MKITSSTIEIEVMWTDENDFSKPGHFISREQNDRNRLSMELLNQLFSNEDLGIDIMFPVTLGVIQPWSGWVKKKRRVIKMLKFNNPAALGALLGGDIENAIVAATLGGIEQQEKQGQTTFVNSSTLPIKMLHGCTKEKLEAMGIVFGEPQNDIFINVTLPDGWTKVATDHSMWSDLLDDKGRKRAGIFYKAAFYDRSAHISLIQRYMIEKYHACDKDGNDLEYGKHTHLKVSVCDSGKSIKDFGVWNDGDYTTGDKYYQLAEDWIKENYPDYEDKEKYWD